MSNPTMKRSTVHFPKYYHTKWKIEAAQKDISMNEFCLKAMIHYFEDQAFKRKTEVYEQAKTELDLLGGAR